MKALNCLFIALVMVGCSGGGGGGGTGFVPGRPPSTSPPSGTPIKHIVVIVQENRTDDNLFAFLPGADTVRSGSDKGSREIHLQPQPLVTTWDIKHEHSDFEAAYDNGKMDGWNGEVCTGGGCPVNPAYSYVPESQVEPYYEMARRYTFADHLFQTNQGPSFPAHQYLLSGTSSISDGSDLKAAENPAAKGEGLFGHGGCSSPQGSTVLTIDKDGNEGHPVYPCFDRTSILSELDSAGISWHYYQAVGGAGLWNAVDALKPIWENRSEYKSNVRWPSATILKDIRHGDLAAVTFVTPTAKASDHAGRNDGTGPDWVASVVNEIGKSKYWDSTAIVVVWDDWGGWYDSVQPQMQNSYENGFRVPMIVISPYAKAGYVDHNPYEFGSILKLIENTFALPTLGTSDARTDGLGDCFDYGKAPRRFEAIKAKHDAGYFERQPLDYGAVDND